MVERPQEHLESEAFSKKLLDGEAEDAEAEDAGEEADGEAAEDEGDEEAAASRDDDDEDGVGGRASASVSAMEEALLEPVLEILNKISSYYDDLKKIQNQRVEAILAGKTVSTITAKSPTRPTAPRIIAAPFNSVSNKPDTVFPTTGIAAPATYLAVRKDKLSSM